MWIYIVICYDALNEGEICNVGCICIHCTDVTKKEEIGSIQETLQTGCVSEVEIWIIADDRESVWSRQTMLLEQVRSIEEGRK